MHRCLGILEIKELICEHFDANMLSGSLAALARTSKDFEDPALDVLWRTQKTLMNLLRCLPSHLWTIEVPLAAFGWERRSIVSYPIRYAVTRVNIKYELSA